MALYLRYAVRSDLGLVRTNNEDSVYAGPRLLAIADGMGGHAAGEVASKIVIGTLENLDEDRGFDDLMATLRESVREANQRIAQAVQEQKELEGMGTTLTALRFRGGQVGLVHVGDSRAYLLRSGVLSQITHDDTYVQYLVDSGKLTPDEAKDHPRRSVILRALLGSEVEPDVSIREARAGDRYLLCSDGLTDVVSEETIAETMQIADTQECADRLVELALRGGGPDNVTVIVADVINARVGDVVDDVPVVAGAFVDPAAASVPGSDSPAERAAQMTRPPAAAEAGPAEVTQHRVKRRHWRAWIIAAVVVVIVAAALGGTYVWTQTQYFVGKDAAEVAIFRGVNTEVGPVKLFSVYRRYGDLKFSDLTAFEQGKVRDGITANSRKDAERIIADIREHGLKPLCVTQAPAPVPPSPSASSSSPPAPSHATSPRASSAPRTAPGGVVTHTQATTTAAANATTTASAPSSNSTPSMPGFISAAGSTSAPAGTSPEPCRSSG
jgi:protein phosphatase